MDQYNKNFAALYNVGMTLEQAVAKQGYRLGNRDTEKGYHSSVWVNAKLVRCFMVKL